MDTGDERAILVDQTAPPFGGAADRGQAPVLDGDPRLRRRAEPVAGPSAELTQAIAQLAATLAAFRRRNGFGRALAAPQIAIPRRMIMVDLGAGPFAVINPEITDRSAETFELWDDCFSVPDRLVRVLRHRSISLTYRDEQFRLRRWDRLPADLAELLQHEIDHLDGILMTDRATGADAVRPASDRGALVDAARPAHRLSLSRIDQARGRIDPVFQRAPQLVSEPLSARLGVELTLKIETINPIRNFKGRGTSLFIADCDDAALPLVCASAGNFGQGLAYACRTRQLPLIVYAARAANALKLDRMRALGAEVRLAGDDFDDAKDAAAAFAHAHGATLVVDGREPAIAEGAGTIARELLAGGGAYDAVVVPVGNGALITGMARWIKARSPATRVIGVCSAGAPVMAEAFRAGRVAAGSAAPPRTIADGIAVRVAIPEAVADMVGLVDDVVMVSDDAVIRAMQQVHVDAGVIVEPAGAAGLAALLSIPGLVAAGSAVATVLCGGNLTVEQIRRWLGPTDSAV
jgi:peptide deformylase